MAYILDQNASGTSESKREEKLWNLLIKNYLLRLCIFAILIWTIIGLSGYFIDPFMKQYLPNIAARIITTVLTLLMISPFLKALIGWETILPDMLSDKITALLCRCKLLPNTTNEKPTFLSHMRDKFKFCSRFINKPDNLHSIFVANKKVASIYLRLWNQKTSNRVLLVFLTSFRLVLLCFFIMTVIHQFLTENPKISSILLILSIFVLSQSRWLFMQYMKIEHQFLDNLNGPQTDDDKPAAE